MNRRSRKQKQHFLCGCRGFGQYCHRCKITEQIKMQIVDQQKLKRQHWKHSFANDPVDLSHLPNKIVLSARRILTSLAEGTEFWQLKGRRFNFDHSLIRIPVGYRYRLLCRQERNQILPLQVLSHESYNPVARNKVRPRKRSTRKP